MKTRKTIFTLALCFLMAFLVIQTLNKTLSSNSAVVYAAGRQRRMTEAQRRREAARRRRLKQLEYERRLREAVKERSQGSSQSKNKREQIRKDRKELQEELSRIGKEFLFEKSALEPTKEKWKLIKAKLEEIQSLAGPGSTSGMALGGSSSSGRGVPTWHWDKSWEGKARSELTESQKIVEELMTLLEKPRATPEQFREKMHALRESRSKEKDAERKKKEKVARARNRARRELRALLTTRQEATLVLMGWL
jgi:hypothetical protein